MQLAGTRDGEDRDQQPNNQIRSLHPRAQPAHAQFYCSTVG
jgi:hypothetical protein